MKINPNLKTTSQAINELNSVVFGKEHGVITKEYRGDAPVQDRLDVLEQTAAGLLVTKYIGPVAVTTLGVPFVIDGQPAVDLLDAMVFAEQHPNDKKAIGLICDVPAAVINDVTNFPTANVIRYTLTLTVFAAQEDASGHTKVLLQGDSPEFAFEITTTINFNTGSYIDVPYLTVRQISIRDTNVLTNGGTLDTELGVIKSDILDRPLKSDLLTQADIDNKTEVPRVVTGKFIAENVLPQDTGWQELSLEQYFDGEIKVRKVGNKVSIKGVFYIENTMPNWHTIISQIPVGYRPPQTAHCFCVLSPSANFLDDTYITTMRVRDSDTGKGEISLAKYQNLGSAPSLTFYKEKYVSFNGNWYVN